MTTRAVSTTLSYVLTLSITVLLISGLFIAAGNFVENERERVVRSELQVIGQRLASAVESADRLASAASGGDATVDESVPATVGGIPYTVTVETGGTDRLVLESHQPDVTVTVTVVTDATLNESSISGGNVVVVYDISDDSLEVESA